MISEVEIRLRKRVFEKGLQEKKEISHRRRQMLQALRVPVKINACKTEDKSEVHRGLVRRGHSDDQVGEGRKVFKCVRVKRERSVAQNE